MRPDLLFTTEQISLLILALLDDKSTFDQYQQKNQTNWLVIDRMQFTTGSVLTTMQIGFWYTPPTQRDTLTSPTQYELTIGYPQTGKTLEAVLITLDVLTDTKWVHCPIRNLPFVIDKLRKYASP